MLGYAPGLQCFDFDCRVCRLRIRGVSNALLAEVFGFARLGLKRLVSRTRWQTLSLCLLSQFLAIRALATERILLSLQ